jgi:hypothetical protein
LSEPLTVGFFAETPSLFLMLYFSFVWCFFKSVHQYLHDCIAGYYFQAPPSASPPQYAWQHCIVLLLLPLVSVFA